MKWMQKQLFLNFYNRSFRCFSSNLKAKANHSKPTENLKLTGDSRRWMLRHLKDPYVRMAALKNYRARSAYKIIEINQKFSLFNRSNKENQTFFNFNDFIGKTDVILECGASPGSWSQVILESINNKNGLLISIDKLYLEPIKTYANHIVMPFQDINDKSLILKILTNLYNYYLREDIPKIKHHVSMEDGKFTSPLFSSILSDMAPNASGVKSLDHDAIMILCHEVLNIARMNMKPDGNFVVKIWDGWSLKSYTDKLKQHFNFVQTFKPDASRDESSEIYIICKEFNKPLL